MTARVISVDAIPDWLKTRKYPKGLSDIDWYRSIRQRQLVGDLMTTRNASHSDPHPMTDHGKETLLSILKSDPRPDSLIFWISQSALPVGDLSASEALYISTVITDADLQVFSEKFASLMSRWESATQEDQNGPTPLFGEYERHLERFFEEFDASPFSCKLEQSVDTLLPDHGNPWLSYGRPLNGHPITVDTQYDDKTLVEEFKKWLAEKRQVEGERVKRPFNQNDIDDWEYYKIRQIFDLECWAALSGVRILDRVMVQLLWPNPIDDFSPIDVLRTTPRKKVQEVFAFNVVVRFFGQMRFTYGENFLKP